ncbi:probable CCR4-associated factor 1 homolog 7 [Prosopis cineraria]|uniref:probable CCR4-associated factor 1 homolog 7 n=1 Tax=Prosopis cineraria TaxID=364024 RepID=UPI00240F3883|nr:probable CCR4-associated factor 1 homolog 7 [Prosopis cineraria]XP_054820384.1 probable CCR4-associated factor 1 homolog 7 [Prosopis cineraria]
MSILNASNVEIRQVWANNLEDEIKLIRDVVDDYPYVAMDTEFPGTVTVISNVDDKESSYKALKENVDLLKLIQLGLTFSDDQGNLPTGGTQKYSVWQFNFREFNLTKDSYNSESIDFLIGRGIDFRRNNEEGVDAIKFSELLMSSGVVLNPEVHWLVFHGSSDFGYLIKLLTGKSRLPDTEPEFLKVVETFFPVIYDVKCIIRFCYNLYGGLDKVAKTLNVERVGVGHQAGSDSLLTCCTFFKLIQVYNHLRDSPEKYAGCVFGLTTGR